MKYCWNVNYVKTNHSKDQDIKATKLQNLITVAACDLVFPCLIKSSLSTHAVNSIPVTFLVFTVFEFQSNEVSTNNLRKCM